MNKGMETTTTTKTTKPRDGEYRSAIEYLSSAALGTKDGASKGYDEKKEPVRTSGCCDKINVGVVRADYKEAEEEKDDKVAQPQQLSSPLRRAEDVREVGSRVSSFLYSKLCILHFSLIHIASSIFYCRR